MDGVGYYPEAEFVHVDVGPVRQWTFDGGRMDVAGHHKETDGEQRSPNEEPTSGGVGSGNRSGQ